MAHARLPDCMYHCCGGAWVIWHCTLGDSKTVTEKYTTLLYIYKDCSSLTSAMPMQWMLFALPSVTSSITLYCNCLAMDFQLLIFLSGSWFSLSSMITFADSPCIVFWLLMLGTGCLTAIHVYNVFAYYPQKVPAPPPPHIAWMRTYP